MGFMDKVKSTAQQAGDKAQELTDSGKAKVDAARTRKKIDDLQRDLGAVVFRQRTGEADEGAEAEIDRLVGEITTLKAELESEE